MQKPRMVKVKGVPGRQFETYAEPKWTLSTESTAEDATEAEPTEMQ